MSLLRYEFLRSASVIPTDFGQRLRGWFDMADTATIDDTAGAVNQVDDKSGNSYNITQTNVLEKPTTNATTQNNNNLIDFVGGDNLNIPSGLFGIPNGANTIIFVAKETTDANNQILLSLEEGAGNFRNALFYTSGPSEITYRNDTGTAPPYVTTSITETVFNVITATFDGSTGLSLSINDGTPATASTGVAENGIDRGAIGSSTIGSLPFTGSIGEILFFNDKLTTVEITALTQGYLIPKWAI